MVLQPRVQGRSLAPCWYSLPSGLGNAMEITPFEKLTAVRLTVRPQWDELHAAPALWPWLAGLTVWVAT